MDWQGRTPLICAARVLWNAPEIFPSRDLGREETIRILVDAGADVTASDGKHKILPDSKLGHVASWGGGDIIRYLARRGSDIHQQRSYPKVVRLLGGVGALGGDKVTPLYGAAHNWNELVFKPS